MKKQLLLFVMALLPMVTMADAVEIDGIYYNLNSKDNTAEVTQKTNEYYTGNVVIPEKVTSENTEYIVTSIGEMAFANCGDMTSVTIGNSVTSIGGWAFQSCTGLTTITIPNSVTTIGGSAFQSCRKLTSVTIGYSVTRIGGSAFAGCNALSSIDIPNSVTYIGGSAFMDCHGLTSIVIPNSVTYVGRQAFWGCSGLTSISLSNSLTSIEKETFLNCSSLTTITIPNSVTSIDEWAFYGCKNLATVISLIEDPFEFLEKTHLYTPFPNIVYKSATLYIPVGTIEKYKGTKGWKDFENVEESTSSSLSNICSLPVLIQSNRGQLTVEGLDDGQQVNVYSINGTEAGSAVSRNGQAPVNTNLQPGSVVIVKIGEKSVKVVVK